MVPEALRLRTELGYVLLKLNPYDVNVRSSSKEKDEYLHQLMNIRTRDDAIDLKVVDPTSLIGYSGSDGEEHS